MVLGLVGWSGPDSFADSRPQDPNDPATPPTVTADALATVQIDGVVWSQAMSGDTVYAGGEFENATPAGGGTSVPRSNLLAYDIVSGELIESFAPDVDRQVTAVAASPDESRIYVGGEFVSIDGESRGHIAAYDGATGELVEEFAPSVNGSVDAIVATNTTVYAGGSFGGVGNQSRSSLAAFNAADGALLDWAPIATLDGGVGEVRALALKPDGTKVVVGGSFTSLNGSDPEDETQSGYGLGMVDAVTGVSQPFAVGTEVRDATIDGAITTLSADDEYVYGGGYTFGRSGGTLEGVFSAGWDAGEIHWINDCHGDVYSVHAQGDVIYAASHTHYCENIAGLRQGDGDVGDYPYFRALAFGREDVGDVTWEPDQGRYFDFTGNRHSAQLTWYPSLNAGTYTGQIQGPWSVTGNDDYIAMGGEFTRVNGTNQSGLVRFAVPDIAPEAEGPELFNATYPISVSSTTTDAVRVHWRANQDADNDYLTYKVQRRVPGGSSSAIQTLSARAHFWDLNTFGYVDTDVSAGEQYEYRVQAADPSGNTANSAWTPVTVASVDTESDYTAAVLDDEPEYFWQLGESDGATAVDTVGFQNSVTRVGVTGGATGAVEGSGVGVAFRRIHRGLRPDRDDRERSGRAVAGGVVPHVVGHWRQAGRLRGQRRQQPPRRRLRPAPLPRHRRQGELRGPSGRDPGGGHVRHALQRRQVAPRRRARSGRTGSGCTSTGCCRGTTPTPRSASTCSAATGGSAGPRWRTGPVRLRPASSTAGSTRWPSTSTCCPRPRSWRTSRRRATRRPTRCRRPRTPRRRAAST